MNIFSPLKSSLRALPLAWALSGTALSGAALSAFAFGAVATAPVFAQPAAQSAVQTAGKAAVSIELQAFKVGRDANGKEQLQGAGRAKPGDVLEYRAVYANVSNREVKNLQATLPIPVSTEVLLDSASPKGVSASSDGRSFAPAPLMQAVKMPDGSTRNQPVPLSAYRALRWPVGTLAAGQNVTVRARVRLNSFLAAN